MKNKLTQLSFDLLHALNSLSDEELETFIAKNSVTVKSLNSKLSKYCNHVFEIKDKNPLGKTSSAVCKKCGYEPIGGKK